MKNMTQTRDGLSQQLFLAMMKKYIKTYIVDTPLLVSNSLVRPSSACATTHAPPRIKPSMGNPQAINVFPKPGTLRMDGISRTGINLPTRAGMSNFFLE